LDILHKQNYDRNLLKKTNPKCSIDRPVIFFGGFCCKDRLDFNKHNEDYFATAIELCRLAKKHNWLLYIKPRQEHGKNLKFAKAHWGNKYSEYADHYKNNPNVHFIRPAQNHIYDYFFADAFVVNGCSTIEIEACAIQKPLIIVRTKQNSLNNYDPYDTVKSGAAKEIRNVSKLEKNILRKLSAHDPSNQIKLLDDLDISFDGQHYKRIQDRIAKM